MNKTIVIIQARMGSTRLSGKVLMPLGDTVVLDYVVQRSRAIKGVSEVIVATSTLEQDQAIVDWCVEYGVPYFCGSEDDVLDRYYQCAKKYSPDYVIRVTADCPFVDYDMASVMVASLNDESIDVVRLKGGLPRGLPVELISFNALEYIHKHGHEPYHREHVTYYAYENPEQFSFHYIDVDADKNYPELRITLDTTEDYQLCKTIADNFIGDKLVSAAKVIQFLLDNPDVVKLNAHIEQKAVK